MTNNYCPECGAKTTKGAIFCGECGTKINFIEQIPKPHKLYCQACDYSTNDFEKFCPNCGQELTIKTAKTTPKTRAEINKTIHKPKAIRTNLPKIQNKIVTNFKKAAIILFVLGFSAMYYFNRNNLEYPNNNHSDNHLNEGFFHNNNANNASAAPKPILKELIAEKTLTESNLTISTKDGRIKMTASATCLDGDTKASITRVETMFPDPSITLRGYDFRIGAGGDMSGVVKIEMPYGQGDSTKGYTIDQTISAVRYNDQENIYEPVHYVIDKSNKKIIIATTHLSKYFVARLNPADYHNNPWIYLGSLKTVRKPNWGVFYTTSINHLNESIVNYDFNLAKNTFANNQVSSLAITKKVKDYGFNNPNILFIDEGLSLLGKFAAYPENTGKVIKILSREHDFNKLIKNIGIKGAKLSRVTSVLGHVGMVVAIGQLGTDLYEGKDHAAFKLIKNLVYWQGDALAEYGAKLVFGFSGFGTYVNIALVSLFVTEQIAGPLETWREVQITKAPEHKKLFSAYTQFTKQRRNEKQWLQIINMLNEKAMNSQDRPQAMQKGEYFEKLLKAELNSYTEYFWQKLTLKERAEYVINSPQGYYYGHYALIHYAGQITDKTKYLSKYLDEIAAGKYPSMKLSWSENYLVENDISEIATISYADNITKAQSYLKNLDNEIKHAFTKFMFNYLMEYKIQPIMVAQKELIMLKSERELHKALVKTKNMLNEVITLKIIDASNSEEGKKQYANHIVMPISDKLSETGKLNKWSVTLDKNGYGKLSFTTLAYFKNGGFSQLGVYPPKTKDFSNKRPLQQVKFNIDNNNAVVYLKNSKVNSLISKVSIDIKFTGVYETKCDNYSKNSTLKNNIWAGGSFVKPEIFGNSMLSTIKESDKSSVKTTKIELGFKNIHNLESLDKFSFVLKENGKIADYSENKSSSGENIPFDVSKKYNKIEDEYAIIYSFKGNIKKYLKELKSSSRSHYCGGNNPFADNYSLGLSTLKMYQTEGEITIILFYKTSLN